ERRGIQRAEQPAGADDRPQGREEQPEEADIAPQLPRRALGSTNQRLREFGHRSTPSNVAAPGSTRAWPRSSPIAGRVTTSGTPCAESAVRRASSASADAASATSASWV